MVITSSFGELTFSFENGSFVPKLQSESSPATLSYDADSGNLIVAFKDA